MGLFNTKHRRFEWYPQPYDPQREHRWIIKGFQPRVIPVKEEQLENFSKLGHIATYFHQADIDRMGWSSLIDWIHVYYGWIKENEYANSRNWFFKKEDNAWRYADLSGDHLYGRPPRHFDLGCNQWASACKHKREDYKRRLSPIPIQWVHEPYVLITGRPADIQPPYSSLKQDIEDPLRTPPYCASDFVAVHKYLAATERGTQRDKQCPYHRFYNNWTHPVDIQCCAEYIDWPLTLQTLHIYYQCVKDPVAAHHFGPRLNDATA